MTTGRFSVIDLPLEGLKKIVRHPRRDERGAFTRLFCASDLLALGWDVPIAQINHSLTRQRGTLRGIHFQRPPHAEIKLVTCLHGEVWDVAVDLRPDSPTFLQAHGERLSAENGSSMLIPLGFGHGFQTLTDNVELLYCHSHPHVPEAEDGLNPFDPVLALDWPLQPAAMSEKDRCRPFVQTGLSRVLS